MKTQEKIFRNVGGNTFKLLTESINNDDKPQNFNLVREGLKKVFASSGKEISYKQLSNVGLGYIKNVTDAAKCALREAQELAPEYGYKDDENNQKFVKSEEMDPNKYPGTDGSSNSSTEEKREVQIGKEIIHLTSKLSGVISSEQWESLATPIQAKAKELIQMHKGTE